MEDTQRRKEGEGQLVQRAPRASSRMERRARMENPQPPAEGQPHDQEPQVHRSSRRAAQTAPVRQERQKKPFRLPLPLWELIALGALVVALALLAVSQARLEDAIDESIAAKEAAHQRVVSAHPLRYRELIEEAAAANNLKPAFMAAIILNESSFRPEVESSVGARGLMQVMEATAGWIAEKLSEEGTYTFDMMFKPEHNIRYGAWYLNFLSQRFYGDPVLVACAYHAGQGEVANWLSDKRYSDDGRTIDLDRLMDGPTKRYAKKVTEAYAVYEELYYTEKKNETGES